jgi:hypothetical protein
MPTTRQLSPLDFVELFKDTPWSPHMVVDYYCEACYVYHCWDHGQEYVPLGDTEGFFLLGRRHEREIEDYVLKLYHSGKLPMPEPVTPQARSREVRRQEILGLVAYRPNGMSAREVALELGFHDSKSVNKHLSSMVRDGLLEMRRGTDDRRRVQYCLATSGGTTEEDELSLSGKGPSS